MQRRLDIQWGLPVQVRERHWSWRHAITQQIVNPDIDGLLTACLLHHLKGWKVVGFYDTRTLYLDRQARTPLDLEATAFVDIDMCWPSARSLSQHVVRDRPSDLHTVRAYATTVNPSVLLGDHSRGRDYKTKYPFGTFQWAWWLVGPDALAPPPRPDERLLTGLAWMPDGGFQSVRGVWRDNCVRWASATMAGSILQPLAKSAPEDAEALVAEAAEVLRRRSGVMKGWRNHQFNLTTGSASGPRLVMSVEEGLASMQALCNVVCDIYGWERMPLPRSVDGIHGGWHSTEKPPPGWPESANMFEVVSMAVTSARRFCWTSPGDLPLALPRA